MSREREPFPVTDGRLFPAWFAPGVLRYARQVKPTGLAVYMALCAAVAGGVRPNLGAVSETLGFSLATVRRALRRLERAGLVASEVADDGWVVWSVVDLPDAGPETAPCDTSRRGVHVSG